MTFANIWDTIKDNPGWITAIIVLLFSLVEVSKIKINPWSALGRGIGKFLGVKDVKDKVDAVGQKVDQLEQKVNKIQDNVVTVNQKVDNLEQKVQTVETKVDTVENTVNENEAITARARILRFSGEVQASIYHDKGLWDHIMADIAKYDKYVEEHPKFKNGITEPTTEYLKAQYRERLEKRDWEKKK